MISLPEVWLTGIPFALALAGVLGIAVPICISQFLALRRTERRDRS